jgi:hypothetical protein
VLVAISVPEPPSALVALVIVLVDVVVPVTMRPKKALVPLGLPNVGELGKSPDLVNPTTRAFAFVSTTMAVAASSPLPPKYVK